MTGAHRCGDLGLNTDKRLLFTMGCRSQHLDCAYLSLRYRRQEL